MTVFDILLPGKKLKRLFSTKILLIFSLSIFAFTGVLRSEAFVINTYHVDIAINSDGSFHVTETINLRFTEPRRGIIRDIPIRYRQDQSGPGERAIRPRGPEVYEIIVENIAVDKHQYQYYREGDFMRVRIGNPNKQLRGQQEYVIKYTVWGALNEFEEHVEFSWNIIGHQWDAPIERASFSITGESGIGFSERDIVFATGRSGARTQNANIHVQGNRITGETTRPLNRFEGISLATRHPGNQFRSVHPPLEKYAQSFLVENHSYSGNYHSPGFLEVNEHFSLKFLQPVSRFSRRIGRSVESPVTGLTVHPLPEEISLSADGDIRYQIKRDNNETLIEFSRADGSKFTGTQNFDLSYRLWGMVSENNAGDLLEIYPYGFKPSEPVQKLEYNIEVPTRSRPLTRAGDLRLPELVNSAENNRFSGSAIYPAYRLHHLKLNAELAPGVFEKKSQPNGVFAKHYLVEKMNILVQLDNRQGIQIGYDWQVVHPFPDTRETFEPVFLRRYSKFPASIKGRILFPSYNLLDSRIVPSFNIETSSADISRRSWGAERVVIPGTEVLSAETYSSSATISYRGLFRKVSQRNMADIPLLTIDNELKKEVDIKVVPPPGSDVSDLYMDLIIDGKSVYTLSHVNGEFIYPGGKIAIPPGESVILAVNGVSGFAGNLPLTTQFYLLFRNNMPIWWLGAIILALYLLWNRFGRNPKEAVVVRFYPPEKITSAEAGLLWDDKLHRKDLISLIYYWAGKGYLEVEEIGDQKKPDYILRKKKDLSAGAKNFEKTFFKGLFFKDEVKLSELKSQFSRTMRKSYKELMAYGKQNDFYVPGSRGFGCVLTGLGVLLLVTGVLGMLAAVLTGHWSYGIAPLTAGVAMILFGRIMPKKGPFGFKKYQKLMGFKEFIRTAEIDRIKALYKDNPGYFDATIAYAIVFGLGKQWAAKFDGLMIEPPEWYKGHDSSRPFTTIYFTNSLIRSMHRMNYDLSMPSTGTGSGSGASSWSGGGGSGFGGGFSSGGGFGGGGGSSW